MKEKIKVAWREVEVCQKALEEKALVTQGVASKLNGVRQKIAEYQERLAKAPQDRAVLARKFISGEIADAEFEALFPDLAATCQQLQAYREMMKTLNEELKRCSNAQSVAKYTLNDALHKAWLLVAQDEILGIMPGLLRAYAAWSAGKIETNCGYSDGVFAVEMMAESFEIHRPDIAKMREKMRKENSR